VNSPFLSAGDAGEDLIPPGFRSGCVALAGRPNVGKSTLLNRLVGTKISIVSPIPQTTRMVIRAVARTPESEIVYLDTPGIHRPQHRMNQEMVRSAREALSGVDLLLLLVEGPEGFGPGDSYMLQVLSGATFPVFLIINKIDAMPKTALLPLIDALRRKRDWAEIFPCSALTGEGCDGLASCIRERLPLGPPMFPPDFVTDLPTRLSLGELIREQILLRTREEIPHSTAVIVEQLQETEKGEYRVAATIFVDRESQKGIVIGKGGEMLKAIGTAARKELAAYLGTAAHLSLWVKVKKGWRDDPLLLRILGITSVR
jgi:GTP-binding protein Era